MASSSYGGRVMKKKKISKKAIKELEAEWDIDDGLRDQYDAIVNEEIKLHGISRSYKKELKVQRFDVEKRTYSEEFRDMMRSRIEEGVRK